VKNMKSEKYEKNRLAYWYQRIDPSRLCTKE
jgi:hypothetical protein